jgi:molybdopterin-guanine dinucleotide biosynthesis protein A
MRHAATCGILAGGASARMGRNKALLEFRGTPLIVRQIELLSPIFEEILIGANDPAPYEPLKIRVVPDLLPERCSLTGVHALLKAARREQVFVVACDMPFLNADLIRVLLAESGNWDAVVAETERGPEPLHAVYSKTCLPAIEESARRGRWKVTDFYGSVRTRPLRFAEEQWLVDGRSPFTNANTPDEWRSAAP